MKPRAFFPYQVTEVLGGSYPTGFSLGLTLIAISLEDGLL